MRSLSFSLVTVALLTIYSAANARVIANPYCEDTYLPTCDKYLCCNDMGGISYCDSSAGRYVCNNGYYSSCYCTRHAVMDLQKLAGCCLWQGGVLTTSTETGAVICNNGTVSEICTVQQFQSTPKTVSSW